MFEGVCPVVNVPFLEDESIDYKGLENMIEFIIERKCNSICLFAFNSEPYKLSFSEKKDVIQAFLKIVDKRVETLIGIVENSLGDCIELGHTAKKNGADGLILYPPALSTPAGAALVEYFKIIAEAVDLPVMIQDNPRSTGVTMSEDMLIDAFHDIRQFHYIKVECPIPMRKMRSLIHKTNGQLKCYSGNGGIFAIDAFLSGASGIMPGVVMSGIFNIMTDHFNKKEIKEARDLFEKILPMTWYEDQSLEFYIACEKFLLKHMGVIACDTARKPCVILSDAEKDELLALFERVKDYI